MGLMTLGSGFDRTAKFDVSLQADASQAVLNLATLKTPPGDYRIAFYGGAVAKYRYNPDAVLTAEIAHRRAEQELSRVLQAADQLASEAAAAPDQKAAQQVAAASAEKKKLANAALAAAAKRLDAAKKRAQAKDIVDIIVSEPIAIRVNPVESK